MILTYFFTLFIFFFFFFKQKTAYEIYQCDWIQTCALPIYTFNYKIMNIIIRQSIIILIAITGLNLLGTELLAQEDNGKMYIQIRVDGLSCPFCAYGLEKKLKKIDGAANLLIELEEGIVSLDVPTDKKPSEEDLRKVVTDAGFTPREIKFSSAPFKKEDEDNN